MVQRKLASVSKLKQQHNWKKGSSSPREASVFVSLSVILSISKGQESRVKECKPALGLLAAFKWSRLVQ